MYVSARILDLVLEKNTFEYAGCHCPHNDTPLYGRAAYWRAYNPNGTFLCKITTKVKVMEPKPETLKKLLKAELKKRFASIGQSCRLDEYGKVYVTNSDPSRVRDLLDAVLGLYIK